MTDYKAIAESVISEVIKAANDSGRDALAVPVTIDCNKTIIVNDVWDNPIGKGLGEYELTQIGREIESICHSKGYSCSMYRYQLSARCWDCTCKFPDCIVIFNKEVCPEFKELQTLCKEKLNLDLKKEDLYRARTSGKRGRYFEEIETRRYTCYNPKECRYLIDRINLCTGKGIKMHIGKHEDQEDRQSSIYYECECYGSVSYDICPANMG